MLKRFRIVEESAGEVAKAASRAVRALFRQGTADEAAFTDRLAGAVDEAMGDFEVKGVRWTSKTFADPVPRAPGLPHAAELLSVLDIRLAGYLLHSGFLAYARLVESSSGAMPAPEWDRLRVRCDALLALSPDAFVFLYSPEGVSVVPAASIVSAARCNPHALYSRSLALFYEHHFEGFIGDRKLGAASVTALEDLRKRVDARRALWLSASLARPDAEPNLFESRG